jgi:hypothetical protein
VSWFGWINLLAILAGLGYWLRGLNQGTCFHRFEVGADRLLKGAWKCNKCEVCVYPERFALRRFYRTLKRVNKEHQK